MTCYYPLRAYDSICERTENGKQKLYFNKEEIGSRPYTEVSLPCGQCTGCRLRRSRDWATRCTHEASERLERDEDSSFLTLTFNQKSLPRDESVDIRDLQLFMKRLRAWHARKVWKIGKDRYEDRTRHSTANKIGFFACGEYGEECEVCAMPRRLCRCLRFQKTLGRPHYHLLIFGLDFYDKELRKEENGYSWYTSETLAKLWPFGWHIIGQLSWQSAAYVARYCTKKVNGEPQEEHYKKVNRRTGEILRLVPEFATMSRRPAIGKSWARRFHGDLYPEPLITIEGRKVEVPKYYDRMVEEFQPELVSDAKERRKKKASEHTEDQTLRRLRDRHQVKLSQFGLLVRSLENDSGTFSDL